MLGIVSSYEEIKAFLSSPTTPDVAAWIRKDSSPSPSFLPSVGQSQSSQSQIEEAKSLATIASLALLDSQQSQNQNRQSKTTPPPPSLVGVTVKRSSDKHLKKYTKSLKKQAAIANLQMNGASSSNNAYHDPTSSSLASISQSTLLQEQALNIKAAGFRSASSSDIEAMRAALAPSGTKEYSEKNALPPGTFREYGDGFEQVSEF